MNPIRVPIFLRRSKRITTELEQIVFQVQVERKLGARAAKRFVGRRLKPHTLDNWRRTGKFPIGFRDGSKR